MVHGAAMIVPAESFDPAATLDAIETRAGHRRCTACRRCTSPNCRTRAAEPRSLVAADRHHVGQPLPDRDHDASVIDDGLREITIAYGQTEASPVITQTRADDPIANARRNGRPAAAGRRSEDRRSGHAARCSADNQQGELCARGHVVMLGYYKNPEATAAAIDADGWLHTGDLAVRLPNGYYRITGRIKDMVIRGGENIYPREIEEFLFTHPAIEQASVVGVPDPKFGEELCAWIKLKPGTTATEEEIREFCRSQLAHLQGAART